jgi:hypothetical protein
MSDLSNDTKKHTTNSRETIPLMVEELYVQCVVKCFFWSAVINELFNFGSIVQARIFAPLLADGMGFIKT